MKERKRKKREKKVFEVEWKIKENKGNEDECKYESERIYTVRVKENCRKKAKYVWTR